MSSDELDIIIRQHRGITKLVAARKHLHPTESQSEISHKFHKIWKDKVLSDKEKYDWFAEQLEVAAAGITHAQFLRMIENAIINAEHYYMDPLQAVSILCKNITEMGGLQVVARRLDKFITKL